MDRQRRLLVLTILISSVIFTLCWSLILWLWHKEYLVLHDRIVRLIITYPTELTLISTVISTILSVTTTALFSVAVKHALSHYITQPLSLAELHTAIALTKPQPLIRWDYRKLSLVTVLIVGLITLLNSRYENNSRASQLTRDLLQLDDIAVADTPYVVCANSRQRSGPRKPCIRCTTR
ncbi:hypothetical protein BDR03DRAFT_182066 [Suillus americanus]|nr:hypothetical protein BDR03DRAFT_182066 [Suillus americanus]